VEQVQRGEAANFNQEDQLRGDESQDLKAKTHKKREGGVSVCFEESHRRGNKKTGPYLIRKQVDLLI